MISQAYREHRPYLVDLAFRMLGDLGAAEDVVQDAFARLLRAGTSEIDDERGWLIVVTSRLALDQMRSARSRRERAHDPGELESAAPRPQPALADPADRITFDDSVRLALLVMLRKLSPAGGQPALLGFHGRALAALLVLRMRGEQVEAVRVIADPAQIGFLGRHLAASAR